MKKIIIAIAVFLSIGSANASDGNSIHVHVEFSTDGLDKDDRNHILRGAFVEVVMPNRNIERIYCDSPGGSWTTQVCERTLDNNVTDGIYKIHSQVAIEASMNNKSYRSVSARVPFNILITTTDHDTDDIRISGKVPSVGFVNPNGSLGVYTSGFSIK